MSLHKFAEQVASQGRGDDSLLVHMTPDEVRKLQQFAQANGTTLTINPTTGLPEAGMLSDLFKMVAPIALGAFLGPAGFGMSSMMAGLTTGGITTLATGSLSRGLMAGLGAYGGSGLADSFMNAGANTVGNVAGALGVEGAATGAGSQAAMLAAQNAGFGAEGLSSLANSAGVAAGATPVVPSTSNLLSSGFNVAKADPMAFAKNNLTNIGMAAAPIMAGMMVPTTTKLPDPKDTGYIRQFDYNINPDTGRPDPLYGMRAMTPVKASEFGNKTFQGQRDLFRQQNPNPYELGVGSLNQPPQQQQQTTPMASGDIVALAGGGDVKHFAIGDLVKADIDKAYAAGDYARVNELAQANKITASDVAETYKGFDASGLAGLGINLFTPPEVQAAPTPSALIPMVDNSNANYRVAEEQTSPVIGASTYVTNAAANPNITSSEFMTGATKAGLQGQALVNAMQNAGLSQGAQYALTQGSLSDADFTKGIIDARTGKPVDLYNQIGYTAGALPGDQAGLKGLYANINYVTSGLQNLINTGKMSVADAQNAALAELQRTNVSVGDVKAATGKDFGNLFKPKAGTTVVPGDTKLPGATTYDNGAFGNYGSGNKTGVDYKGNTVSIATPGDIITNPDGTRTVVPNVPGRPYGGFTGMEGVKSAYTAGGGSLGYTAPVPKTAAEHNAMYNKLTDDSLDAYNFLMGKGKNLTQRKAETRNRPVMQRYDEAVLGRKAEKLTKPGATTATTAKTDTTKVLNSDGTVNQEETDKANFDYAAYLKANPDVQAELDKGIANFGTKDDLASAAYNHYVIYGKAQKRPLRAAEGGMMGYAVGGGIGSLGSYSDGGRLLKGPGDGVSDSIPATIGEKQQPARLADGEFVIPARIVSELGNGSTDAGAKKLYAMMDRVQRARGKTTGKNKVAANSRSDKYLPA